MHSPRYVPPRKNSYGCMGHQSYHGYHNSTMLASRSTCHREHLLQSPGHVTGDFRPRLLSRSRYDYYFLNQNINSYCFYCHLNFNIDHTERWPKTATLNACSESNNIVISSKSTGFPGGFRFFGGRGIGYI